MHKYLVYLIQSESISITCGNDLLNEQNTAKLNTNKILDIQRRNDNIFTFSSLRHIWKCISVGRMAAVVGLTLLPPRLVFAFPLVIFFFFFIFSPISISIMNYVRNHFSVSQFFISQGPVEQTVPVDEPHAHHAPLPSKSLIYWDDCRRMQSTEIDDSSVWFFIRIDEIIITITILVNI